MPKVRLDPKFVYSNSEFVCKVISFGPSDIPVNWNIFKPAQVGSSSTSPIYVPQVGLIPLGNNHSSRHGNRITVTSIRLKSIFSFNYRFLIYGSNPYSSTEPSLSALSSLTPHRFLKLRYFVIEFDEDLQVNLSTLYSWFKRTYCWYRPPGSGTVEQLYDNAPVSTHANILHETTDFTGKFNILCDKCITLSSYKPQISLDITVPLNRQFVYDEDDTTGEDLLFPNIFLFVLPPLSLAVDVDPLTSQMLINFQRQTDVTELELYNVQTFTKMSFVDL